jgi:hypothetical protein
MSLEPWVMSKSKKREKTAVLDFLTFFEKGLEPSPTNITANRGVHDD